MRQIGKDVRADNQPKGGVRLATGQLADGLHRVARLRQAGLDIAHDNVWHSREGHATELQTLLKIDPGLLVKSVLEDRDHEHSVDLPTLRHPLGGPNVPEVRGIERPTEDSDPLHELP